MENQEYEIWKKAKEQGKDDAFIKGAISAYRQSKGIEMGKPVTPITPQAEPSRLTQGFGFSPSAAPLGETLKNDATSLFGKIGKFFTGNTQQFGKTIGESLAAPKNASMYDQALQQHTQLVNNLKVAIADKKSKGEDASRLVSVLNTQIQNQPTIEDFTGEVINKTNKQVIGEAAGTALEALSGGLLETGAKTVASKGLTFGQRVKQGAGIGGTFGTVAGASEALKENKGTGDIVFDSFLGGVLGAGLGAGLEAGIAGIAGGTRLVKNLISPSEEAILKAQSNYAKAYEKTLNLTPRQKMREDTLLKKTGDNVYTTAVKNGFNLGSEKAPQQIQSALDTYSNIISEAQKNEYGLFNLDEVIQNTQKQIAERIASASGRNTGNRRVLTEIEDLIAENPEAIIKGANGENLVNAEFMERLRKTGNSWTPFNASDPEKVGQSVGFSLADSVREQVEKQGTFPSYREAMREWGKIIHLNDVIGGLENANKKMFRVPGGLSGSISRKILSGALGFHSAGLPGLVIGELGAELGAEILGNPEVRSFFNRKILEAAGKVDDRAVTKLAQEVREFIQKQKGVTQIPQSASRAKMFVSPTGQAGENLNAVRGAEKTQLQQQADAAYSMNVEAAPITTQTANKTNSATISTDIPQTKTKSNKLSPSKKLLEKLTPEQKLRFSNASLEEQQKVIQYLKDKSIVEKQTKTLFQAAKENFKKNGQAGFIEVLKPTKGDSLTTKILSKLAGKKTVSKQFIEDLTNSGDIKQVERDLIRDALKDEGATINVSDFAKKVKAELLPLNVNSTRTEKMTRQKATKKLKEKGILIEKDMDGGGYPVDKNGEFLEYDDLDIETQKLLDNAMGDADNYDDMVSGSVKYEYVSLPSEQRGSVADYFENIYESPIKTSAGFTHFGDKSKNYFGHTRIEDMADNKTRRVIEVQSDLYQKGRLEGESTLSGYDLSRPKFESVMSPDDLEKYRAAYSINSMEGGMGSPIKQTAKETIERLETKYKPILKAPRKAETAKLLQYNNPTAHFRMVREEIKKAAQDGKTKLQFPTGETAMKIEGLGVNNAETGWYHNIGSRRNILDRVGLEPQNADDFVGLEIYRNGDSNSWIITDVLGDGKFKAVPKSLAESIKLRGEKIMEGSKETFDISGKVDTNNPIYRFYEKDLARYLKKYDGKLVTDKNGVTWIEVPVKQEYAGAPVEAFGRVQLGLLPKIGLATGALSIGLNLKKKKEQK